jgi:hypothetical protein
MHLKSRLPWVAVKARSSDRADALCLPKKKAAIPAASVPCFNSGIQGSMTARLSHLRAFGQSIVVFQLAVPSRNKSRNPLFLLNSTPRGQGG